jgi:hypothetical protein
MAISEFDFVVIGSGPSSAIALSELVKTSASICVISMNENRVSDEIGFLISEMSRNHWERWGGNLQKLFIKNGFPWQRGIGHKPFFGSLNIYDDEKQNLGVSYLGNVPRISTYFGGFSNVWGGVLERKSSTELDGWPIELLSNLDSYYDEVINLMSNNYGLILPNLHNEDSDIDVDRLMRNSILFKASQTNSRIAIRNASNCNSCGLCQIGCPYNQIWSAKNLIEQIVKEDRVSLIHGLVYQIIKIEDHYEIKISDHSESHFIKAKNILIGAGPIGTPSILQRSKFISDQIIISDNQTLIESYFNFNFLRSRISKRRVSLADAVLEYKDSEKEEHNVNIQLYFNFLGSVTKVKNSFKLARLIPEALLSLLFDLTVNTINYLDANLSGNLLLRYDNVTKEISLSENQRSSEKELKKIRKKIKIFMKNFGFFRIPINIVMPVGGGYHIGASLPMKSQEIDLSSPMIDCTTQFGELNGYPGIFIIDSSNFPHMPKGSIALLSMANSLRISQFISTNFTGKN